MCKCTKHDDKNSNINNCCDYYFVFSKKVTETIWGLVHPKSIKFSAPASSARPLFNQSAISSFTSFPKSSCNFPNSSFVPQHTSNHSSIDGVRPFDGTTFAFLFGHSFGEILPGPARAWNIRLEFRLPPPAEYDEAAELEVPELAAGCPASALLFGMKNAFGGWLENSSNASD